MTNSVSQTLDIYLFWSVRGKAMDRLGLEPTTFRLQEGYTTELLAWHVPVTVTEDTASEYLRWLAINMT